MVYLKKHCLKKDYFIDLHVCGNISQPPWNFSILKLKSFLTPLKFLNPTNPPPPRKKFNPSWKISISPEKSQLLPKKSQPLLKNSKPSRKNLNPPEISQPHENFSTPPPPKKKFLDPPRKFLNPPPKKKISRPSLPENFSPPPKNFSNPPENISTPKNILTIYTPLPFLSFFFLLLSTSFPSLSTKNLNISGGRFEPPIRPWIPHLVTQ